MLDSIFRVTIKTKLWFIVAIATAGIMGITLIALLSERAQLMEERRLGLQQTVETAHGVLAQYHSLATLGKLADDDAKRAAIEQIRSLRYNEREYFFIIDGHPRTIMHPVQPQLEGKDVSDVRDANGTHVFLELANAAKAAGGGFVTYMWPKAGSTDPVMKVSYVKAFAPWGWSIGSGVYLDTVNAVFWDQCVKLLSGALILVTALLIICTRIARSITRPITEAVSVAKTVASGDLTSKIHTSAADETGDLLRSLSEMNEKLRDIVGQVHSGSSTIAAASSQIAAGNCDLSARTEQQASSLEQTAAAMEELTSTVQNNAQNALQANDLVRGASDVAQQGRQVISQAIDTMRLISDSAKKIEQIIAIIDGIAFQTNILSLNAAVEAARAGEQGKGFAVVATEVRNLAQRSASAAKDIKTLIVDSAQRVDTGTLLVEKAGVTMEDIVSQVTRVSNIMSEISEASREQSSGIQEINKAIVEMDHVTQQNAQLVEEAASAASSLNEQAIALSDQVRQFKLDHVLSPTRERKAQIVTLPTSRQSQFLTIELANQAA